MKRLIFFTLTLLLPALAVPMTASAATPGEGKTIALDAGHGGADPGAVNTNPENPVAEKDQNRAVVDILKEKLEGDGATVIDVRPGDETVDLYERPKRANAAGADISVSVHHNSATPSANGTETYFADAGGQKLGAALNSRLLMGLGTPDRGVQQKVGFVLTRLPTMPAVITEGSFVTNDEEAKKWTQGDRAAVEADCLYQGINDYFSA